MITACVVATAALGAAGCAAGPRLYVNPQADMTLYKKVAFLPFTNLSPDRFAAERISRAFMTELIIADRYRIVEPAQTAAVFERIGVVANDPSRAISQEKFVEAAALLGVQGFVRGAVTEYQVQRLGGEETAVLSFDVEMIDAATGNVVGRTSIRKKGRGRRPVVGGSSTRSFGALTQQACRQVVAGLQHQAF